MDIVRPVCDNRAMSAANDANNVDYSFRDLVSRLIICGACLKRGRITPIPQIVSPRHTPRSLCGDCLKPKRRNLRRILTHLETRTG